MALRSYYRPRYSHRYSKRGFGYSFSPEVIIGSAVISLILLFLTQFLGLGFEGALYALFGMLACVVVALAIVGFQIVIRRRERERSLELSEVDKMTGIQFENYLVGLLKYKGYTNIELTPPQGDYGADLIVTFHKQKIAVQAKQYNSWKPVGVEAIYQVLGGERKYHCSGTMVITTGFFTPQAYVLAEESGTELIDRTLLADWITEYRKR